MLEPNRKLALQGWTMLREAGYYMMPRCNGILERVPR
jgi:hypothetical protein